VKVVLNCYSARCNDTEPPVIIINGENPHQRADPSRAMKSRGALHGCNHPAMKIRITTMIARMIWTIRNSRTIALNWSSVTAAP
jgi:hypothetical protein